MNLFFTQLGAADFVSALVGVLAVIGIIIVGGFVIFFLGDLLLSVLDPSYVRFGSRKAKEKERLREPEYIREEIKQLPSPEPVNQIGVLEYNVKDAETGETYEAKDVQDVDLDAAKREEEMLRASAQDLESDPLKDLRAEEEAFKAQRMRELEERRLREIEERRLKEEEERKRMEELESQSLQDIFFDDEDLNVFDDESDDGLSDFNFDIEEDSDSFIDESAETEDADEDAQLEEITAEEEHKESEAEEEARLYREAKSQIEEELATLRELIEAEKQKLQVIREETGIVVEPEVVEAEEIIQTEEETAPVENPAENEEEEVLDEEREQYIAEIELLKKQLEAERSAVVEARKQAEDEKTKLVSDKEELERKLEEIAKEEKSPLMLTLDEYTERLEVLKERLASNEKELRKVKKEFIPLRRVKKNLESDAAKLRRKEAIVAKQKVMLYGVNNIVDIDEEKAKKLSEDLDLLDGLRLSVQHCEEVMSKNKDRYPILEKTFDILTNENANIKSDIDATEAAIESFKDGNNEDASTDSAN